MSCPSPRPISTRAASHAPDESAIDIPISTKIGAGALTLAVGGGVVYWRYLRRLPTTSYFTPSLLQRSKHISGTVVRVGDGDGFRLYHQPGGRILGPWLYPIPRKRDLSVTRDTISIRLAGADAPEMPHFGKPGQPFAQEAMDELTKLVIGRYLTVGLGHLDQYNRLVGTPYVWLPPYCFGPTNISLYMVKLGLATVYTQSGAEYGKSTYLDVLLGKTSSGERRLLRAQEAAKRWKRGMWSQKKITTPAEFKATHKG